MQMSNKMSTSIINVPSEYFPADNGKEFYDDLAKYTCKMFKDGGVKCACGSIAIHTNMYSFQHQHCKTKKHKKYIQDLTSNRPNIIKTSIERSGDIKALRILQKKQEHQLIKQGRRITELESEHDAMKDATEELQAENEQLREHIQNETKKTSKTNKKQETKLNKAEELAMAFLTTRGYEFGE